ncbi:unnamed protein product, partial [marine sediment metagenome]
MYLRNATEGIRVLDMEGVVGAKVFAIFDEVTEIGSTIDLMAMGADGLDTLVESAAHTVQGLQAQSPSNVSDTTQTFCPPSGQ